MDRKQLLFFAIITLLLSPTMPDESCQLSESDLSQISEVLTHMDQPIYTDEMFANTSSQCTEMLDGINYQLRRLTQRYKLMAKGYMKVDEYQKMAREYDEQLKALNNELEQFQKQATTSSSEKLEKLKGNIVQLEQNVDKLHHELQGISAKYAEVKMDLCVTYLETNQMSKARAKLIKLEPKWMLGMVQKFLNISKSGYLPVIDICLEIGDLDDRGEGYKAIFEFMESNKLLDVDDFISLEAEVRKMNATLKPSSKITDIRRQEIQQLLYNMQWNGVFQKWANEIKTTGNFPRIKNTIDRMVPAQLVQLVDTLVAIQGFDSARDLLKLFAISNNFYKVSAYRRIAKKKIGRAVAVVMLDMDSMERKELKFEPQVPDEIRKTHDETFKYFPDSLKKIYPCLNNVHIFQGSPNSGRCIVTTDKQVEVKHPKHQHTLGHMKQVILNSTGCTAFRLELVDEMASVKIIDSNGNALTNINAAVPGNTDFSFVGAPYVNKDGMKLDSSQLWLLEADYKSGLMKIESEFNDYRSGESWKSIDYLVHQTIDGVLQPVVGRWGIHGLLANKIKPKDYYEWTLKCAS